MSIDSSSRYETNASVPDAKKAILDTGKALAAESKERALNRLEIHFSAILGIMPNLANVPETPENAKRFQEVAEKMRKLSEFIQDLPLDGANERIAVESSFLEVSAVFSNFLRTKIGTGPQEYDAIMRQSLAIVEESEVPLRFPIPEETN